MKKDRADVTAEVTTPAPGDIDYSQYNLKWQDEFDGDKLNRDDWNVELHEPGWVNAELQEYVDSGDNIYLKDGKLEIKPIQTKNADGTYSYTSGRITTQNKHDYTYGLFEARVKVPEGKGYLPAFWVMPTDENIYGQWPRCGEIDIMEVLGDSTNEAHNTIHYGNPHNQNQGNYTLPKGSFADGYHTFSLEWLPGELIWYIDGKETYRTSDWYSTTEGQGTITYPAPFDQPFYVILNLAVGGSWVGYPDDETFQSQNYSVDYVRIYQKDSYDDSDVKRPSKNVGLGDADGNYGPTEEEINKKVLADGNYVYNGKFQEGDRHLGFWDITKNNAEVFVTDFADGRRLKVVAPEGTSADKPVVISQSSLALADGDYALSFDIEGEQGKTIDVNVAGIGRSVDLTGGKQSHNDKIVLENTTATDVAFTFKTPGTYYLDNVRIVEYTLIKNGNFNAGFTGYEPFIDGSAAGTYVVNGLTEDNVAEFTIDNTGDQDWKIQLKQNNVELEKDQWYRLAFSVKSSLDRAFMYAILRDGSRHNDDWTPYVREVIDITGDWTLITKDFQMKEDTDFESVLSFSMGAVGGTQITDQHRISIDNISLEKIEAV